MFKKREEEHKTPTPVLRFCEYRMDSADVLYDNKTINFALYSIT
jgi:hypothetical protein